MVTQILYSGLGGHGSVAFSLAAASRAANAWAPSLIFFGVEPVLPEYRAMCTANGITFQHVGTKPRRAWLAWPALYRALERSRPDAIVLHSVKAILPCALYAHRHGIPILAIEHQANALKRASEWWISRLLMRYADSVVVLTPEYRAQLQRGLGGHWRESKVHVISNGIDTDVYSPSGSVGSLNSRRVVGMASRMTEIKRQDLLIDAMAILCAEDGNDAWQLSLAGVGETLQDLRTRVSALQLDEVVSFVGYLGEAALQEWFRGLDIYAHASSGETLSTSMIQALAMGLPVVGSDVAGIDNLLGSGGGVGLPVAQTPEAFARAIRQLIDDPDLASGLRTRARALAVSEYGQLAMFEKYQCILGRLCAG
nr:glycosyltransferase family 4 protein [Dokdonella immobilis]